MSELLQCCMVLTQDEGYQPFWLSHYSFITLPALLSARSIDSCADVANRILDQMGDRAVEEVVRLVGSEGQSGHAVAAIQWLQTLHTPAAVRALRRLKDEHRGVTRKAANRALRQTVVQATAPQLEIRTLGRFDIRRDDMAITSELVKSKKAAHLLKLFLSSPQCSILIEVIGDELWPEMPLEKYRHNLNVHISHLRNALFPERTQGDKAGIILSGDAYRLVLGPHLRVDAFEFESQLARADACYTRGQDRAALDLYVEACSLYHGDYLPDDLYEEWADIVRQRVRRKYMDSLLRIGDIHMRLEEPRQATGWFGKALASDGTDEVAVRRMLQACAAAQDRALALKEFQIYCQAVKKLDMEPSPEIQAMMTGLFNGRSPADAGRLSGNQAKPVTDPR